MRRTLVFALLTALAGCAFRGGATEDGARSRRFYLTKTTVQGNKVLDACTRGYHTASRFEIVNVSLLRYDGSVGVTSDDSGMGPPGHAAAYGAEDALGWVRTGGSSRFTETAGARGSASTNCAAWTTNSPDAYGTVAYLSDRFTSDGGAPIPLWDGGAERCNLLHHVWCVEDHAAAAPEEEPPRGGRRWRHHE